ncbi:MAG TPA: S9 family peptidase [Candidatus Acidoferrales bacterium]|nr:S9 family peptidase [Candidatus Acidoferrales bacterium]
MSSENRWLSLALSFALACFAVPPPAAAQEPAAAPQNPAPRAKDGKLLFGTAAALRLARVSSPRISPDGARIAYLVATAEMPKNQPGKSVTQLWVVPAAGPASAARQYTRGDKSVSNVAWSPDGKLLAFTIAGEQAPAAVDRASEAQVWFIYADGGEPWQVTRHKGGVRSFEFSPDGKTLLLVAAEPETAEEEQRKKDHDDPMVIDRHLRLAQLWTWDVASGAEKQLTHETDYDVIDPRWSPDGARVAYTLRPSTRILDPVQTSVWVLDVAGGHARKLADAPAHSHTARWSPDGKSIAYLGFDGGPGPAQTNLYVVAAAGGPPRKLGASFALDAGAPVWSPDGARIFFSTDSRQSLAIFSADVASGDVRQLTDTPGVLALDEISRGGVAVGTWTDPEHPAEVFRSDIGFQAIDRVTGQNAWLADYALGSTEVITWKNAKDGTEIDGIVTKPVDYDPTRKYPFLLNPHGGPTGASLLSFNPQEQIFAANGYLVLEPNFRGSTGRGLRFAAANENDWGGGDFQDDMSGVDAVVARGWADPGRMGAVGWSYGGYMTLWIDTQTDRFKAISPGAGLSDLYSMYSETDSHRYLAAFFGMKSPWENFDQYWAHSPMKFVGNVKTPTLILGGQADIRVPIPQAEEFYRALFERGVPVEFVMYPRENHGFVEPRHIQDRWQRYLVFFGRYLANPPVTEPEAAVRRLSADLPAAR